MGPGILVAEALLEGRQEMLLRVEIQIEGALRHAGPARDGGHGGLADPLVTEDAEARVHEVLHAQDAAATGQGQ